MKKVEEMASERDAKAKLAAEVTVEAVEAEFEVAEEYDDPYCRDGIDE